MQQLLVSVRGPREAIQAAKGGANIADVEYPVSALGTPYPLNILAARRALDRNRFRRVLVSTNIGEHQQDRASACQAALGVAAAGADVIKCGLAALPLSPAVYQGRTLVRTVKYFNRRKKVVPAVFVDPDMQRFFNPFREGVALVTRTKSDGLLIDTLNKSIGRGLLDYCGIPDIRRLARHLHRVGRQLWVAGSLTVSDLELLWPVGVDVICVRAAACQQTGLGRFGEVKEKIVAELVATRPVRQQGTHTYRRKTV
jgi:uncharacterized protein (UPF0264 family)